MSSDLYKNAQSPIPEAFEKQQISKETRLFDFSLYPRVGLRGKNAKRKIEQYGLTYPTGVNQTSISDDLALMRLGHTELWLLSENKEFDMRAIADGAYDISIFDSHAWLVLQSPFKSEILSKICGVDMRAKAFPVGAVAQTSVAKISAIVVHHNINDNAVFSLLCDRSMAEYFWLAISDAMQEFI